jgi:hypothetical protein
MITTKHATAAALSPSAIEPRRDDRPSAPLPASGCPTFGEIIDEILPLIGVVFVAGPPVIFIAGPWLLLALMLSGPFALLVAFGAVMVVAAVLLATLAGIFAMTLILVRRLQRTYRMSTALGVPRAHAAPVAVQRKAGASPSMARKASSTLMRPAAR